MKQKLYDKIRSVYVEVITRELINRFGDCEFNTHWNMFLSSYTTTYEKKLPKKTKEEIKHYIQGFSDGYVKAMEQTLIIKK